MPKYFCDYCDTYLTHDSPSVRKTHCSGRKHKENVRMYYQKWLEDQVQKLVDDTTAAFKQGKIPNNPFQGATPPGGAMIPPPANMTPNTAGIKGPVPAIQVTPMVRPGMPPMRMMTPAAPMPAMMQGMRAPMGGPMRGPMGGPMGGPVMRPMMGGPMMRQGMMGPGPHGP